MVVHGHGLLWLRWRWLKRGLRHGDHSSPTVKWGPVGDRASLVLVVANGGTRTHHGLLLLHHVRGRGSVVAWMGPRCPRSIRNRWSWVHALKGRPNHWHDCYSLASHSLVLFHHLHTMIHFTLFLKSLSYCFVSHLVLLFQSVPVPAKKEDIKLIDIVFEL